jgi:hypothetical protein
MNTATEVVSPSAARAFLDRNTRNRPLRQSRVEQIVRDIQADRWHLHHQGIALAPSFVVDGQHRLHAIVQADTPVRMQVTRYDTDAEGEAALTVVDRNAARNDADVQTIAGVMAAGTARAIVPILKGFARNGVFTASKFLTTDEMSALYFQLREHVDWAVSCLVDPEAPRKFGAPHRAAFVMAHVLDADRAERLAAEVVTADGTGSPVSVAWTKLGSQGRLSGGGPEVFLLCLRLLQSELAAEKEPPKVLKAGASSLAWFKERLAKREAAQ